MLEQLGQLLVPILVSSSVTGLVALSFHLVLRTSSGIADFAIGQYAVVGGLTAAVISQRGSLPIGLGIAAGVLLAALLSTTSDVVVFRPLERLWGVESGAFAAVVASVALLWIWEQATGIVYGEAAQLGPALAEGRIEFGEIRATGHQVVVVLGTGLVFACIHVVLSRTPLGRLLRAVGDSRQAAETLGLSVQRARIAAFAAAGAIAGLAGVFAAPLAGMRPSGGTILALNGFVALFLGGVASPLGSLLGAGVLEAFKILVSRFVGSAWLDYTVLAVALVVFAFRPQGLLGSHRLVR